MKFLETTEHLLPTLCGGASASSPWFFLFCLSLFGGCQTKQQAATNYSIVADIEGCKDCKIVLWLPDSVGSGKDTVTSPTGRFSWKGKVSQPGLYALGYWSKPDVSISGLVQVYLPTDSVHISITKKLIRTKFYQSPIKGASIGSYLRNTAVFSTSPLQRQWEQYLLVRDSLWYTFFVDKALVMAKFNQTIGSGNRALMEQWGDSARSFDYRFSNYLAAAADQYVRQHPASVTSLWAMLDNRSDRPAAERFRRYYQAMPAPLRTSYYGQLLDKQLALNESRNQNNPRFVGSYIDHLAGKTPQGKALATAQLFTHNKLTLIDFWASWCPSCRLEMPKYYKLYKQYHGQGFGMLGISLDHDYNRWVQAIADDSLQMPHLSELQGGNGEDMRRFAITGIPANMLVDSRGRVVAVDITPPKLQQHLQQAL